MIAHPAPTFGALPRLVAIGNRLGNTDPCSVLLGSYNCPCNTEDKAEIKVEDKAEDEAEDKFKDKLNTKQKT